MALGKKSIVGDVMIGMDGRVVEGLPASYDNIAEDGSVLYLDAERLARKENPPRDVFENHPHGLGMKDRFWSRFSVRPWNFNLYAAAFHLMKLNLRRTEQPDTIGGAVMRSVLMMARPEKGHSGGTVFNLCVRRAPSRSGRPCPCARACTSTC